MNTIKNNQILNHQKAQITNPPKNQDLILKKQSIQHSCLKISFSDHPNTIPLIMFQPFYSLKHQFISLFVSQIHN